MFKWITCLFFLSILACEPPARDDVSEVDAVARSYWPDGTLRAEIPKRDGKQHGLARAYFQNGKLSQEIEYKDGQKHGVSKAYYESGKIWRESFYEDNELHGIRKQYWSNGNLRSLVSYHRGFPCSDLREYYSDGREKDEMPGLLIYGQDEMLTRDRYVLHVRPTERVKKIRYFRGILGTDGCFDPSKAVEQAYQGDQQWSIYFPMPEGTFRMEEVFIVAWITTDMGNPYLVEEIYPLAIER